MNPMQLYITTCRYVTQANYRDPREWDDLYRLLPFLRQSLSCYVCFNIVHKPMGPVESACAHHCCKECVGGKMRTKPSCSWCKDFETFEENHLLGTVVKCFKKMCQYIASAPIFNAITSTTINGGSNNILTIIQEGLAVRDVDEGALDSSVNSNISLPPPILTLAPPIVSPDNPQTHSRQVSSSSEASNSMPPIISQIHLNSVMHDYAIRPTEIDNHHSDQNADNSSNTHNDKSSADGPGSSQKATKKKTPSSKKRKSCDKTSSTKKKLGKKQSKKSAPEPIPILQSANQDEENSLCNSNGPPELSLAMVHNYSDQIPSTIEDVSTSPPTSPTSELNDSSNLRSPKKKKLDKDKKGCRCGNATANPGKLTCYGQRCPCYSNRLACLDCCCRGCRNPYKVAVKIEAMEATDEDMEITVV